MNLVSFSAITRDYYPQFDFYSPGGNSLNFAVHFKKYSSGNVAVVGAIGEDNAGRLVLEKLGNHHIDISHVHITTGKTAQNQLRVDEKGERYGIEGTWNGGSYESYLFKEEDWDFINRFDYAATTAYDPQFQSAIQKLKPECKLSVDFLHLGDFELLEKYHHQIAIAFFEGREEYYPKAKKVALQYPDIPVVITLGAKGSKAFLGNCEYFQPAPKVEKVLDTTGCGDSYQAAFAYTWFTERNIEAAMNRGTLEAGRTLSHFGGIE
jgi:fructoselysine 6-kinase